MYSSIVNGLSSFAMFSIDTFLSSLSTNGENWVSLIVVLVGLAMMGFGIFKVGKGFISDRAQTNWVMAIGAIILGGALAAGGLFLLRDMSSGVLNEVNQMGGGTAALFFSQYLPW